MHHIEVNIDNVRHNIGVVKEQLGVNQRIFPCLKANAYGHGLSAVSHHIQDLVDGVCVQTVNEATQLRSAHFKKNIIVLGYATAPEILAVANQNIIPVVGSLEMLESIGKASDSYNKKVFVHLKIDTGMHRQGITESEYHAAIKVIKLYPNIILSGLATHCATADDVEGGTSLQAQLTKFKNAVSLFKAHFNTITDIHAANSSLSISQKDDFSTVVRPGLVIYGYAPGSVIQNFAKHQRLKPSFTFKTIISQLKDVPVGGGVSYGHSFVASKPTQLAVLPVGYAHGLPRALSNKGHVLIHGQPAPIRGRVCMNIMMVDISNIQGVTAGDEVVCIGEQEDACVTLPQMATWSDSIAHEVLVGFPLDSKRTYIFTENTGIIERNKNSHGHIRNRSRRHENIISIV